MVRLFFENTQLPSPVAAVRWCVDKADLDYLKEKRITDPFLALISTKPREKDSDGKVVYTVIDHKIVPLDQAMEYLEFRSSGELRVFGQLVWCKYYGKQRLNQNRLDELIVEWRSCSIDSAIESWASSGKYTSDRLESGYADITVPEGYFAKEPSELEKWWVSFWYESKPKNQCQFRKRRMLAYTVQPFVVIPYALIRSVLFLGQILIFMLLGARKIEYGAMFHPFSYRLGEWEVVPDEWTPVFTKDASGKERNPFLFILTPLVQIILFVVSLLVWKFVLFGFVSL